MRGFRRVRAGYLLLNGELDLDAARVRLRPHKARVHQLHLVEALEALDTEGQKLTGLEVGLHPRVGRIEVSGACKRGRERAGKREAHLLQNLQ